MYIDKYITYIQFRKLTSVKDPDYHLFYKQDPDPHIKTDPGSKTNQYHLKIKIFLMRKLL